MPEDSGAGGTEGEPGRPDASAADAEAPPAEPPEPAAAAAPVSQVAKPPRSRRALLIGFGAGLLAAALVAGIVVALLPSGQAQKYTTMPAPCTLVSTASLTKYVQGAPGTQRSAPSSSAHQQAACTWINVIGPNLEALAVEVDIYSSSSGVTLASQHFGDAPATCLACAKPVRGTTHPVTGLGDQATATFMASGSGSSADHAIVMFIRSGNADIFLNYAIGADGPGATLPANAVLLADATAMARDVLASLANPAAAKTAPPGTPPSSPAASPTPPPGPVYANPHHPCKLVSAATLARYLPGAAVIPAPAVPSPPPGTPQASTCGWGTDNGVFTIFVTTYPPGTMQTAQQGYDFDAQYDQHGGTLGNTKTTVNEAQPVTGIGNQAIAIFQTRSTAGLAPSQVIELLAWSGNAQLEIMLNYGGPLSAQPPSRTAQRAAAAAIARDILAALPKAPPS
jgi:hypothetical protein